MRIIEEEFVQRFGTTVKVRLRGADGRLKNHYHRYKTEEKAKAFEEIFRRAIGERA